MRKTLKPILEILAGIPTVAIGFFAVSFILPEIIQPLWPGDFLGGADGKPFMALAAGLGIGLMIVPIIASISEDAMSAVPRGLREGAYALGATKAKVATRVVFPAALSGIVASIVLAISRAVGETMIVVLAAGSTPNFTFNPVESIQAMTSYIAVTATGDIPDRLDRLQIGLRGRHRALRDDPGDERDQHPAGPQVPRGLRVMAAGGASAPRNRLAVAGARATTQAMLRDQPRGDVIRNTLFAGAAAARGR